jgi:putative endonuclease
METQNSAGYYVYMLVCSDGTIYSGFTTDPLRRTAAHNSGKGAKYTRPRLPVKLAYQERFETKSDALKREAALKKLTHAEKLALIRGFRSGENDSNSRKGDSKCCFITACGRNRKDSST